MTDKPDDKKLIIDDDWKQQVKAEKERLAREKPAPAGPPGAAPGAAADTAGAGFEDAGAAEDEAASGEPLPEASFELLVQTLAAQAMMFLTPQRDPKTGRVVISADLAKHSIDLLGVLEEKTRGNLTDAEKKVLDAALYQTRMVYVQSAR